MTKTNVILNAVKNPMGKEEEILRVAQNDRIKSNMQYYVYIVTNKYNTVVYIGVTNNISRRMYEHKNGLIEGFTKRYNLHKLVYCETFSDVKTAIQREKQLKGWKRERKNALIERLNPEWSELSF